MAGSKLSGEDTFVVYHRPRIHFGLGLLSAVCFFVVGLIVYVFLDVSPRELWDTGVRMVLFGFAAAGAVLAYLAWRAARSKRIILSADELGVWTGLRGRRQTWDEIATIRIRPPIGDPISTEKFIAFEPQLTNETTLGRALEPTLRGRMISMRLMNADADTLITGLRLAAEAAGFDIVPVKDSKDPKWQVIPR